MAAVPPVAPPPEPEADLRRTIRVLENRLAAQAWDIKGLTAQRDQAYENLAGLREELAALREELLTLSRARAAEIARYERFRGDLESGYALARELRHARLAALARQVTRAPQTEAAREAELMLIRMSGLFDEEFYRAQREGDPAPEEDAALHYITGRRGGGAAAQPSFPCRSLSAEAVRAGCRSRKPFRDCARALRGCRRAEPDPAELPGGPRILPRADR